MGGLSAAGRIEIRIPTAQLRSVGQFHLRKASDLVPQDNDCCDLKVDRLWEIKMDIYDLEAYADFAPDDLPFHSPEYIYRWLKNNPFDPSENFPCSNERAFEKERLALNSSLVNFGLAKFGASSNTMKRLYSLEDSSIRYAALSGVGVSRDKTTRNWVDDILDDIAENLDDEGLEAIRALITNQNIPDDILINFLRRTDFFHNLTKMIGWICSLVFQEIRGCKSPMQSRYLMTSLL